MQRLLPFDAARGHAVQQFSVQLLKWVGNKQRYAHEIASFFPTDFGAYYEPFLGSGAVMGTLAPKFAVASDAFGPLIEIWQALKKEPGALKEWYAKRRALADEVGNQDAYEQVKTSFNACPNGADLLYLCRACYGGVVRFRKADGYISTPCGVHRPISTASFARRVDEWRRRCQHTEFIHADFEDTMSRAQAGDLVYCDPPYVETQSILYGAQSFSLERLFETIASCKARGVKVALSIDGTKRSGDRLCDIAIPQDIFEHEAMVNCGRSMLRRFQMAGQTLENEVVADRLLLTYTI